MIKTTQQAVRSRATFWPTRLSIWWIAVGALAVVLLTTNLTTFPVPWFDDGYVMAIGKMLATEGIYGLPDANGPWVLDQSITSGPTLILPIAAMYWLFGAGVVQARLMSVLLAAACLVAYGLLSRRLVGRAAPLAMALLLLGNGDVLASFAPLARQPLGEVLALGLWCVGSWLWLRTVSRTSTGYGSTALAGLLIGLALMTKPQMLMGVAPACVLALLADRLYYRQAGWARFILLGITMVLASVSWYVAQVLILTPDVFFAKSAVLQAGVQSNILSIDRTHIEQALGVLWRSGFVFWGVPGLLYGAWQARARNAHGFAHGWLLALNLAWLGWFVLFSIGWGRYAFVPLALTPIWSAALLVELLHTPARRWAGAALLLAVLLSAWPVSARIFGKQDTSHQQIVAYLRQNIPADALIASWEWNLDSEAPQQFVHPPPLVMYQVIDMMQEGQRAPRDLYDPAPPTPDYIIDGPFSNWTGIFRQPIAARAVPVTRIGNYTLYKVVR